MEAHLVQTLGADLDLLEAFGNRDVADWLYPQGALGEGPIPADPERPYMQWNEFESVVHQVVKETSNSQNRTFQLFVYDDKGDFTRINQILRHVRRVVKGMAPFLFVDEEGVQHWCSEAEWQGISRSVTDDQYDSSVRYGLARFTVNEQ